MRMKVKLLTLRETITTPLINGIFFNLASSNEFEFINDNNKKTLNIDYYDIYSSEKLASKIFQEVSNDYVIVDTDDLVYVDDFQYLQVNTSFENFYETLSNIIIERFKDKWNRLYDALKLEYNVIENYNMKETRTIDTQNKRTIDTSEDTYTEVNSNIDNSENVNRFGFDDNGSNGSPYEKRTSNSTGSKDDNYSNVGTTNSGTDTLDNSGTEELERTGNIGVTTSQQMLESEIRLRIMNNLIPIIYKDIDSVLISPIYRN